MKIIIPLLVCLSIAFAQVDTVEFWLTMDDSIRLDCSRFIPSTSPPEGGYPGIIFCHGHNGSKFSNYFKATRYAEAGYFCVTYSVRGGGDSEGYGSVMGFRDQQDLEFIVDWLVGHPVVNDTLVAVTGGSQGGMYSFLAGVRGMNVRAVAPAAAAPLISDSWARNGCYLSAIRGFIEPTASADFDTIAFPIKRLLLANDYDSLMLLWNGERYFDSTDIAASDVDFMIIGGFQDVLIFNNRLPGIFMTAPQTFLFLGAGGHGAPTVPEEALFSQQLVEWFMDEKLKGEYRGLDTLGPFVVAIGPDWEHYNIDTWPPPGTSYDTFYFNLDSNLSIEPPTSDTFISLTHERVSTGYSWEDAVLEKFLNLENHFLCERHTFRTQVFDEDRILLGIPCVELSAKGSADAFQLDFQFYIESLTGELTYLTNTFVGCRENPDSSEWQNMSADFDIMGWLIPTGSRIRVDWSGINMSLPDSVVWTVPYWNSDGEVYLAINPITPAQIRIPFWDSGSTNIWNAGNIEKPNYLQLITHPNPFNSAVTISVDFGSESPEASSTLPPGACRVEIFDVNGRMVDNMTVGAWHRHVPCAEKGLSMPNPYECVWQPDKTLPSGVYLVRARIDGRGDLAPTGQTAAIKRVVYLK